MSLERQACWGRGSLGSLLGANGSSWLWVLIRSDLGLSERSHPHHLLPSFSSPAEEVPPLAALTSAWTGPGKPLLPPAAPGPGLETTPPTPPVLGRAVRNGKGSLRTARPAAGVLSSPGWGRRACGECPGRCRAGWGTWRLVWAGCGLLSKGAGGRGCWLAQPHTRRVFRAELGPAASPLLLCSGVVGGV